MAVELTKWFRRETKRICVISNQACLSDEEEKVFGYVASHKEASVCDLCRNLLRGKSSDWVEEVVARQSWISYSTRGPCMHSSPPTG
jgi:hypothetical protein